LREKGFDVVNDKSDTTLQGIVPDAHLLRESKELLLGDIQTPGHARQRYQARQ